MAARIFCIAASQHLPGMLALALFLIHTPAMADDYVTANLQGALVEAHDQEVKVSGNIIVGVMISSAYQGLLNDQIGIRALKSGEKSVCLKVTSRDGAYLSANNYSVNLASPGIINLPYHSHYRDVVEDYSGQQDAIAITARADNCQSASTAPYYLPAVLNKKQAELEWDNLSIYVNGFEATDVFYRIVEAPDNTDHDCEYIEQGRHTAYNFSCNIANKELPESGPLTIEIAREVYGRELPSTTIHLLYAR